MAGLAEPVGRRVEQAPVDGGRRGRALRALRGEPALEVRLVPDRVERHARDGGRGLGRGRVAAPHAGDGQRQATAAGRRRRGSARATVGARVAGADCADERAELGGVRPVDRAAALAGRAPLGRVAAELEQDAQPARLGAADDRVIGIPGAGRIGGGVGAVEAARLRAARVGRCDSAPAQAHLDDVDAKPLELVEPRVALLLAAEHELRVVLKHRRLRAASRGRTGDGEDRGQCERDGGEHAHGCCRE
jgi:hypothetical protein